MMVQRATRRREHYYRSAVAPSPTGERVIAGVHAVPDRRVAESAEDGEPPRPLQRLAEIVAAELSVEERHLLAWSAEGVPQRLIAEWTGTRYETVRKRIQRLCARLRSIARMHAASFPPAEQRAIERLLDEGTALPREKSEESVHG